MWHIGQYRLTFFFWPFPYIQTVQMVPFSAFIIFAIYLFKLQCYNKLLRSAGLPLYLEKPGI